MFRWLAICILLAGGSFALVALVSPRRIGTGKPPRPVARGNGQEAPDPDTVRGEGEPAPTAPRATRGKVDDDRPATLVPVAALGAGPAQPLTVQEARILAGQRQEVPSERDGRLLVVGTPLRPGDDVRPEKIREVEFADLVIEIPAGERVPLAEQIVVPDVPVRCRKARDTDTLLPGRTHVSRRKVQMRVLDIGDKVEKGQLVALVNPALAIDDLEVKRAKLDAAEADRLAARANKEEAHRRYDSMTEQRRKYPRSVSDEDYRAAKLYWDRYIQEELSKAAAVVQAQRELSGALTQLRMHEIHAAIPGVVKILYKNTGDAVKSLDQVLQLQDPDLLRVEGTVEVQEARKLRKRLDEGRRKIEAAKLDWNIAWRRRDEKGKKEAQQKWNEGRAMLAVVVEASRPEPPLAILKGHLQDVTCVGVARVLRPLTGPDRKTKMVPQSLIVSGSEDQTVRIWEQVPGTRRWRESLRLDHHAVVRALACTPEKSKVGNLVLTGTATGRLRLFNLDNLKTPERKLDGRHSGPVNAVCFSPDGTLCATGGDDRAICLWETATGKQLGKLEGAHRAAVTSLQFAAGDRLVSAGRDARLAVWSVTGEEGKKDLELADEFERRSGDVPRLGVSPDGKYALFDEGRELRVLSLADRKIVSTLSNPAGTVNFATLALFAPDGRTVLTNGAAPGRLQLWRASAVQGRAAELRQFMWTSGLATCGAFSPDGTLAVTGTADHQVLVWEMPGKDEAEQILPAQLTFVEEFLDTSLKKVAVRVELKNPPWRLTPGLTATLVFPHSR
jgi:WD40 repeat protein